MAYRSNFTIGADEDEERKRKAELAAAGKAPQQSWGERMREAEAKERARWDSMYRETHGGLSKGEVQAAGPDGSGRQYRAIAEGGMREAERQFAAQQEKQRRDSAERIEDVRRDAEINQGAGRAKIEADAKVKTAEIAAEVEKNKTKTNAEIEAERRRTELELGRINNETAQRGQDKGVETARVKSEGEVAAAREGAKAAAARQAAVDQINSDKAREAAAQKREKLIQEQMESIRKAMTRNGRTTMTPEEIRRKAEKMVDAKGGGLGRFRADS